MYKLQSKEVSLEEFAQHLIKSDLITTGVGKSGIVAHLAATIFTSHGKPTIFVSYEELTNGSMAVTNNKTILLYSKSGRVGFLPHDNLLLVTQDQYANNGVILNKIPEYSRIKDCPTQSLSQALWATIHIADHIAAVTGWTNEDFLRGHPEGGLSHKYQALAAHREVPPALKA